MNALWKMLNYYFIIFFGLAIGLMAIIIIAVYVAMGPVAKDYLAIPTASFMKQNYMEAGAGYARAAKEAPLFGFESELSAMSYLMGDMPEAAIRQLLEGSKSTTLPAENLRWHARALAAQGKISDDADVFPDT